MRRGSPTRSPKRRGPPIGSVASPVRRPRPIASASVSAAGGGPRRRGDRARQPVERQDDPAQHERHAGTAGWRARASPRRGACLPSAGRGPRTRPCPGRAPRRTGDGRTGPGVNPSTPTAMPTSSTSCTVSTTTTDAVFAATTTDDPGRAPAEPLEDAVGALVARRDRERHDRGGDDRERDRARQQPVDRRPVRRPAARVERAEHEQDTRRDDERDEQGLATAKAEPELVTRECERHPDPRRRPGRHAGASRRATATARCLGRRSGLVAHAGISRSRASAAASAPTSSR